MRFSLEELGLLKRGSNTKTNNKKELSEFERIMKISEDRDRVLAFIQSEIFTKPFKKWQEEFLLDVIDSLIESRFKEQHVGRFQIVGGNGIGKTKIIGIVIIYYMIFAFVLYPEDEFRGVMFAGNEKQVKALWSTIEDTIGGMKSDIVIADGSKLVINPKYIKDHSAKHIHFEWRNWSDTAGGIAGIHGKNIMVFFDEATEIPKYVYDKVNTYFTSCKGLFIISANPVRTSCEFYKIYNSLGKSIWNRRKVSRYDFEDVAAGKDEYSNMVAATNNSTRGCNQIIDVAVPASGLHNKIWRETVLGEFTEAMEGAVFPQYMLNDAVARHGAPAEGDRYYIGVDLATEHGTDKSVIVVRSDTQVVEIFQAQHINLEDKLFNILREKVIQYNAEVVAIDNTSIGHSFFNRARKDLSDLCNPRARIISVGGGEKSSQPTRYYNKITEAYYNCRDWVKHFGGLPKNDELLEELAAFVGDTSEDSRVEYRIDKKIVKAAIGRSPDTADALAFSCIDSPHELTIRRNIRKKESLSRSRPRRFFT